MRVEPFLLRADSPEAFERPAGVQVVVGEAAADQCRYLDVLDRSVLCRPPFIEFWSPTGLRDDVDPTVRRDPKTDRKHDEESVLADPAGPAAIAVEVGEALPRADRSQMRRTGRRGGPLGHRQVRHLSLIHI